jgi:undecaprenyl-diphosphatase
MQPKPMAELVGPCVPSDRVSIKYSFFFIASTLRVCRADRAPTWGTVVSALGVLVAWARIYLGLHFPLDMLASTLIACFFSGLAALLLGPVQAWFMPFAEWTYEGALIALRLPIALIRDVKTCP